MVGVTSRSLFRMFPLLLMDECYESVWIALGQLFHLYEEVFTFER